MASSQKSLAWPLRCATACRGRRSPARAVELCPTRHSCSAVLGKWHPVSKELLKQPIEFSLQLNDEVVQTGNSGNMIFSFNHIICDISQYFAINIGDLIYTGTPSGVGECVVGDILTGFLGEDKVFEIEVK